MDSGTALPKRPRLNPYGKALRRQRIFARLRAGWAYDDIAREERVTPRRVRQIVSEALQRRQVDGGSDHAMLQLARLEQALRLSAEAVAAGEIAAIAPYLKVLAQLDRYHGAASAKQAYDEAARERLFAKINRVAARLDRREAAKPAAPAAGPSPDPADAPEPERNEAFKRLIWIHTQALEKARIAEEKSLDFASPGLEFPSSGFGLSFPGL